MDFYIRANIPKVKGLSIHNSIDAINTISIYLNNSIWRTTLIPERSHINLLNIPAGNYHFTDYYVLRKGNEYIPQLRKSIVYKLRENIKYALNISGVGVPVPPFKMFEIEQP